MEPQPPLFCSHADMNAAYDIGDAVPLAITITWLARYQDAARPHRLLRPRQGPMRPHDHRQPRQPIGYLPCGRLTMLVALFSKLV